jgi:hypothetical protein
MQGIGAALTTGTARLPLWFKLAYLAFLIVLVPVYALHHGIANFLWFSNVALLAGLAAAWLESRRLASMLAVAVLLPELGWILGFLSGLARGGEPLFGITAYVFDADLPRLVRGLALYHLVMPAALLWMVWRLGYDDRAWLSWLPIGWSLLLVSRLVTTPDRNVNWAFGPAADEVTGAWQAAWLAVLFLGTAGVWWVTHKLLEALFGSSGSARRR